MPARFSRSSTSFRRWNSAFAATTAFSRSAIAALSSAFAGGAERPQPTSATAASTTSNDAARRSVSLLIAMSSLPARRILVVKRRHAHAGVGLARLARRPIRLDALAERVILERLLGRVEPAALIRRDERRIPVQLADLPNAVLLHVLVLVGTFAPVAAVARAVDAEHQEPPPARFRRVAVRGDGHDRLELAVLVERAFERALLASAQAIEIAADAVFAGVNAARTDLERRVGGEEIEHLVPKHLVGVEAVAALQVPDLVDVRDARGARVDFCEAVA